MSLTNILEMYKGTNIECIPAKGLHTRLVFSDLDCNCVDDECAIETYCES